MIVRDGQEAVDYLSGNGRYGDRSAHPLPALVVLDLKMPRMSGFDVLTWLMTQPEFKKLSAVSESVPGRVEMKGFKVYHLAGGQSAAR